MLCCPCHIFFLRCATSSRKSPMSMKSPIPVSCRKVQESRDASHFLSRLLIQIQDDPVHLLVTQIYLRRRKISNMTQKLPMVLLSSFEHECSCALVSGHGVVQDDKFQKSSPRFAVSRCLHVIQISRNALAVHIFTQS